MDKTLSRGYYYSGHYVVIRDKILCDELKATHIGTNFFHARRKEGSRQGPSDSQIAKLKVEADQDTIILTLHEAFFLLHSLKSFILEHQGKVLDIQTCWNVFRRFHDETNITLDFAVEYRVYQYFKSRGWIVKSGYNYGADFILYTKDPSLDHAEYSVSIIYQQDARAEFAKTNKASSTNLDWNTLLTTNRVTNSVGKKSLLVCVTVENKNLPQFFGDFNCVNKINIAVRILSVYSSLPFNKTN